MANGIFDEKLPLIAMAQIVAADTTTLKLIESTGPVSGVRFDNVLISNSDSIDHKVVFWYQNGGVNYSLGSIDVPAGSGHGGVAAVDAVPLLVATATLGFPISNNNPFYYSVEVTVTSGAVQCVAIGGYL